jgi:hypothetical protein
MGFATRGTPGEGGVAVEVRRHDATVQAARGAEKQIPRANQRPRRLLALLTVGAHCYREPKLGPTTVLRTGVLYSLW